MPARMMAAADIIAEKASALGFAACGFAPAHLGADARDRLRAFLEAGYQGEMGWLAERSEQRSHPQALWPEARSVVVVGMSYAPAEDALATLSLPDRGNISIYARNRDYHDIIKGKLKHLAQFIVSRFGGDVKVFVDTAPVMEKPLAEQARTRLARQAHKSRLPRPRFLAVPWRDFYDPKRSAAQRKRPAGACGSCDAVPENLPDGCLPGALSSLDATRCISYLTIEHAWAHPGTRFPAAAMGNHIYGCDDCLAVCPWNRFAKPSPRGSKAASPARTSPLLASGRSRNARP